MEEESLAAHDGFELEGGGGVNRDTDIDIDIDG